MAAYSTPEFANGRSMGFDSVPYPPEIARRDVEVDNSFLAVLRELLTYMIEDPRTISTALDIVFIAKSLERIGDHAKNISEYVVYMIKGKDVRHVTLEEIEAAIKP